MAFYRSSAKYIIRLDDACPTSNKAKWKEIERLLDKFEIKPIVGVIPDNKDTSFYRSPSDTEFWGHVRRWNDKGWAIAQHGYNHLFHFVERSNLILPFYDRSEFAGLDLEEQINRIALGYAHFTAQGLYPKIFVAPGHAFDTSTITALKVATPIRIISDGIELYPYQRDEFSYIPQQIWWPSIRPFGVWTICLHPDTFDTHLFEKLENTLSTNHFKNSFITPAQAIELKKDQSISSYFFKRYFWMRWELSRYLAKVSKQY